MKRQFLAFILQLFLLVVLVTTISIRLTTPLAEIGMRLHRGYNEGWNAYHTTDVLLGKPLYQKGLTTVNYPPVSFYLIALISTLTGQTIVVGRILSCIALLAIIASIVVLLRRCGARWYTAAVAGFFAFGLFTGFGYEYIAFDDPQLLAQAIILLGFLLYFRKFRYREVVVACIFSIALFTKQIIVALPIAITFNLFFTSKRAFLRWVVTLTGILFLLTVISQLMSNGLFLQAFFIRREVSVFYLKQFLPSLIAIMPVFFTVAVYLFRTRRENSNRLFLLYMVLSLLVGLFFAIGSGTDFNMFFDLFISMSLGLGVFLEALRRKRHRYSLVLVFVTVVIFAINAIKFYQQTSVSLVQGEKYMQDDIRFLKYHKGQALCEKLDLCFYAGKPLVYDPYFVDELIITRQIKESDVLGQFARKNYALIQLDEPISHTYFTTNLPLTAVQRVHARFTENMFRVIGKNYHLVRVSENGVFYAPN